MELTVPIKVEINEEQIKPLLMDMYEQGRADAINEFKKEIMELSKRRYMHAIYSDDIVDIADKLKEQKND